MANWITSPGIIATLDHGANTNITLSCDTENLYTTYSIISGSLPRDLILPTGGIIGSTPGVWGLVNSFVNSGNYSFTIRAIDSNGNIADRTFSIVINDNELMPILPLKNLGIFPDGTWISANVSPISTLPGNINLSLINNLPSNLTLTSDGIISGVINPEILYILPNTSNVPNSIDYANISIGINYTDTISANYNMTIMRSDLYSNIHANTSLPNYHSPIFLDAIGNSYINIGNITGDKLQYKFNAIDFESDEINYQLINGSNIPGNIILNTSSGWLTGYIDPFFAQSYPYEFEIRAFKTITENSHSANPYQTILPVYLTLQNDSEKNIQWNSPALLGNIIPGMPSTLSVTANIIDPFQIPNGSNAAAYATMRVIGADIIDGGYNFSNENTFTISGGICSNEAIIIVTNVDSNGTITDLNILNENQKYTTLPNMSNITWLNPNGKNALIDLNFGIDSVIITNTGKFYDSATVGFGYTGETASANATVTISNGEISNIIVTYPGEYYTAVPDVTIIGKTNISPTNPIFYSLADGNMPVGLELNADGTIVGIPSTQWFSFNDFTILDSSITTFDLEFKFNVTASIGTNKSFTSEFPLPNNPWITPSKFKAILNSTITPLNISPATSGNISISHGLGVTPSAAIIQMTSAGEIWFTGSDSTNLYLTTSDSNLTAIIYLITDIVEINDISDNDYQTIITSDKQFSILLSPTSNFVSNQPKTNLTLEFLLSDNDHNTLFSPLNIQSIVPNSAIYRPNDFYFGKQTHARMLMAYGISPVLPDNIIAAMAKYHNNKTFLLTNLKWAQSTTDGYEVIYIQPKDEYTDDQNNTYYGPITTNIMTPEITVDQTIINADSYILDVSMTKQTELYPATIPNMISQLNKTINGFDDKYLPTWMTDNQPNGTQLGFIPSIPLLYVLPGQGIKILFYLQQYYDNIGPSLNTIQAQTDRYIWNSGLLKNWNVLNNKWNESELTKFDSSNITVGTSFDDFSFFDVSDKFLNEDDGSIYLKFKNSSLIGRPNVGV